MYKKLAFIVAALGLIFSMTTSYAQREFKERLGKDIQRLNLTDEQEKQITSKRLELKEILIDLNAELKKRELERDKLFTNEIISREQLLNITKEISEIKNKIASAKVNHSMDVYDILDADQKVVWREMQIKKEKFRDGMKRNIIGKMDFEHNRKMRR